MGIILDDLFKKLNPCRCGSSDITSMYDYDNKVHMMTCNECFRTVRSEGAEENKAIDAWNGLNPATKYAYSFNGEEYEGPFNSYEEALENAKDANADEWEDDRWEYVYIGECTTYEPNVNVNSVIEAIQDDAYDKVGDYSVGYLDDVTEEQENELAEKLTEVFRLWAQSNGYCPTFFTVDNVKEVKI